MLTPTVNKSSGQIVASPKTSHKSCFEIGRYSHCSLSRQKRSRLHGE